MRVFVAMTDTLICLSEHGGTALVDTYPGLGRTPRRTIRHGHYKSSYPPLPDSSVTRKRLGLPPDGLVILCFGMIREYKGIPELIDAFIAAGTPGTLLIAGEATVSGSLRTRVENSAQSSANVRLLLRPIPTSEVSALHSAADVVVLPYKVGSALNSGAALLALSLGRPVVMRDTDTARELQQVVGDQWVRLFRDDATDALGQCLLKVFTHDTGPDLTAFDWATLADMTIDAYEHTLMSAGA